MHNYLPYFFIFVPESANKNMIEISGLKKRFGKTVALKHIDLDIGKGEFFGLLGPNGAGKTTTINILSTILKPDSGKVRINGYDLDRNPGGCKASLGIVPQEIALYEELTAWQNLMFWGGLYNQSHAAIAAEGGRLLKLFELFDRRNTLIKHFSGGMKRRINIAAAMLHQPKILLMDEPTVGVDPQSRNKIYEVLERFSGQGVTIIYTTHYMDEVEKLCDRIGIIDHGEIIACGNLEALREISGSKETIIIHYQANDSDIKEKLKTEFQSRIDIYDDKLIFRTDNSSRDLPLIIGRCNALCSNISHIAIERASLEAVFLKLTGRKLRD